MRYLPDAIFSSYDELTPAYLLERGIKALIVDVDNTLIPYEEGDPRPGTAVWLASLKEAGIAVAFVTNNHKARLMRFNEALGLPAFYHSLKPFSRNMKKAMRQMGARREETANIGDQIFTDTFAGKFLGLRSFLVPPIRDKKGLFTRFKRELEKPFLRAYYRRKIKERTECHEE